MRSKLKIIIPIIVAVAAIIIAALAINFTSDNDVSIGSLIETAQNYLNENKYEQAIAEFEKAIKLDPMNVDAYIGLAQAYIGIGDRDKAIEALENGIEATGDQRLKDMLEELSPTDKTATSTSETVATTVPDNSAANDTSESSQIEEIFFENKVEYADGWYSIFEYDLQEHLKSMSLYNDKNEKRVQADFTYINGKYKESVYVDDVICTGNYVYTHFHDVMADREKELKNRAGTRQYAADNNNWYEYDENGYCTSHGWHNFDQYGNLEDEENVTYCNYDEKGYLINESNSDSEYITLHNDNSEPDMKMWHWQNGESNGHGVLGNNRDGFDNFEEYDKNGLLVRSVLHSYSYYDYTNLGINLSSNVIKHSNITYYIPSYDGNQVIGELWLNDIDAPALFGCPYCNE